MRNKLLSALFVFLSISSHAFADSQGPSNGGTFASSGSGVAWANPTNAQTSNNVRSTATVSDVNTFTAYLKATNFGFTIPAGSTIDGIKMEFERSRGLSTVGANGRDNIITLVGLTGSQDKAINAWPGTTDAYATYGGATDKWNTSDATPTNINASTFGAQISGRFQDLGCEISPCSTQMRIDHIRITVYYTAAKSSFQSMQMQEAVLN